MKMKIASTLLLFLTNYHSAFAGDGASSLSNKDSIKLLPKGTRLVVKSDQVVVPPDSGDTDNAFSYSSILFVNGQMMAPHFYFLAESLPSPAVSCEVLIEPANYERRLNINSSFVTSDIPTYHGGSLDPLESSLPYFSTELETPESAQGSSTSRWLKRMRRLNCARSVNVGKFIPARYDITIEDLQTALGRYIQVVLPEPTAWDPSSGTNSTTGPNEAQAIQPLAAICNMTPQYEGVKIYESRWEDNGGFPQREMEQECRLKGGNYIAGVVMTDNPSPIAWYGIRKDARRKFSYECYRNNKLPVKVCERLQDCLLTNTSKAAQASILHHFKSFKCEK